MRKNEAEYLVEGTVVQQICALETQDTPLASIFNIYLPILLIEYSMKDWC